MITLLGAILGFVGSVVPEFLKLLQDRRDKAHELELIKLQADSAEKLREYDAKIVEQVADYSFLAHEQERLENQLKNDHTGIGFVDAANAMVRPVVAYGFFILYTFIKIYTIVQLDIETIMSTPWIVWTDEDAGIFSTIIAFYFGSRHMKRTMGRG